jgi:hypothetical protein
VARDVPVARQAQMLAVLAVTGAAPLTLGVILWVMGSVLQAGYHGHWAATAGTGEVLIMAGLICGLCMFVLAANSVRWMPGVPVGRARRVLRQLASPEQQAWLADQPPADTGPMPAQPDLPPPDGMPPGAMPQHAMPQHALPRHAVPSGPPPSGPPLGAPPPGSMPAGNFPPGEPVPGRAYPPADFPPERPWSEPGSPQDWPVYPDPPGRGAPYLAGPGDPEPGGRHER